MIGYYVSSELGELGCETAAFCQSKEWAEVIADTLAARHNCPYNVFEAELRGTIVPTGRGVYSTPRNQKGK